MFKGLIKLFLLPLCVSAPHFVWAQGDELDVIELELEKSAPPKPSPAPARDDVRETNTPSNFSGLGDLSPFSEISVIQKRFLPKTGRFQLFGGGTILTNNPFFNTLGFVGKAGYFFSETWGVELNYFGLTTSEREVTTELRGIQGVATDNLVTPESFVGLDLMFVPIYGKMSWFDNRIVPFDLYFSAGYGSTGTNQGQGAGTLHLSTGQIFAISKAYAFRWDFSWNFYNTKGINGAESTFNNLFLTVGLSWFFPEASYR